MRKLLLMLLCTLALTASQAARADFFTFDVIYSGSGQAVLGAGSDDPVGLTLVDGDSFTWTLRADGDEAWTVDNGNDFFPLMAFEVNESGERLANFTLTLYHNGVEVFSEAETNALNNFVHVGSNTTTLSTGLVFDELKLDYLLIKAVEDASTALDPTNLLSIGSTIKSILPINGPPEQLAYSPGISFSGTAVPEPTSMLMLLAGMGLVGMRKRAGKRRA